MHYGHYGGWITVNAPNEWMTPFMGNRQGPTEFDVKQLGKMYECLSQVTPLVTNAALKNHLKFPGCFNADGSKKKDASNCAKEDCVKGSKWYNWATENCRHMCKLCV